MERLIYLSSPFPSQFQLMSSPLLPRLAQFKALSHDSSPSFPRQIRSFSSEQEKPMSSSSSSSSLTPSIKSLRLLPPRVDSPQGLIPKPRMLKHFAADGKQFQKKATTTGKIIMLSALIITSVPALALPAFATIQTAPKPGAQAAAAAGARFLSPGLLSSAWTGFFAGCLHTLSGPDHLAALAPLTIGRTRIESALVGALWGCGHDAGQVIFGLIFLLLKDRLHIEIIQTWGTRVVGLTLLAIGAMGIREASETPTPCVALETSEFDPGQNPEAGKKKKKIGFATFATGIVHGLQPDALMMVLPALALPSRLAGAAFLCMFLVGAVIAMGSYTVFIGSCTQALKDRVPKVTEKLTWISSLVAIALGLAILVSQLFGFSLY